MVYRDISKFSNFNEDSINKFFKLTPEELSTIEKYTPNRRATKTEKVNKGGSRKPKRVTRRKPRN